MTKRKIFWIETTQRTVIIIKTQESNKLIDIFFSDTSFNYLFTTKLTLFK